MARAAVSPLGYIDSLSHAEQLAVFNRLAYQFKAKDAAKSADFKKQDQVVFNALCDAVGYGLPMQKFSVDFGKAAFAEMCEVVHGFVNTGIRGQASDVQRAALTKSVFLCLIRWMGEHASHVPVSHKSVLQRARLIPVAVDMAFPGYLQAGMLARIAPLAQAA